MPMVMKMESKTGPELEKDYLQMMIEHHKSGVKMADMALEKAKHAEIKDFATKMKATQTEEIGTMTTWLDKWYQTKPSKAALPDDSKMMMDKTMKTSMALEGDDFDKMFLTQMAMHHNEAIKMSELEIQKGTQQEAKEFAGKIAKDQQSEVQQLRGWKKSWYPEVMAK